MLLPIVDPYLEVIDSQEMPSKNFQINGEHIRGFTDDIAAVKQAAFLILNTEKGVYPIYPENYGIQTLDLIGKSFGLVASELQRRIKEALKFDERVLNVEEFEIYRVKDSIYVKFKVESIFGRFDLVFSNRM